MRSKVLIGINMIFLLLLLVLVISGLVDTIQSITSPEKYNHVQYSSIWKKEDHNRYIFRNLSVVIVGILIGFVAFRNLFYPTYIVKIAYYILLLFFLEAIIINVYNWAESGFDH